MTLSFWPAGRRLKKEVLGVRGNQAVRKIIVGLFVLGFVGVGAGLWTSPAAEEPAKQTEEKGPASAEAGGECCKAGDTTPPTELVDKIAAGQLHSPYPDYAKLAKEQDLVKDFRLPGCNECHGGGGGGGMCPALSQGIWFWGNTDDVLFRLVTLGSAELEKRGFDRITYGSVHAPMPPMGFAVKTSDDLWKIIAFICSINPPGANPPEKVVPARMKQ